MWCWSVPVVLFLLVNQYLTVGTTVVPDATGSDVVDAEFNNITKKCISPDCQVFLRHLAMMESTDGRDIKTQNSKYHGGIKMAYSKFKTMNTGNATGKGNLKPSKAPALHNNTFIGRNHNGHKTEGILNKLCTRRAVKEQRKFPHPSDRNKYIICSTVRTYSIRNCHEGKYFNDFHQVCTMANCEIPLWVNQKEVVPLDKSYPNPCKIDTDRVCDFIFVSHLYENTKFIQCDKMGHAILKTCPIDWIWSNQVKACIYRHEILTTMQQCQRPMWDNPNEVVTPLPPYYVNPCKADWTRQCDYIYVAYKIDKHKFIRCDRLGQALIKTCPGSSNWNAALNQCSSSTIITTPRPQCPIPAWDNPNEIGTALPSFYRNPCHADSSRACDYIYMKHMIDNHQFIRCDRLGQALIKTCPGSSNWNAASKQCSAGLY